MFRGQKYEKARTKQKNSILFLSNVSTFAAFYSAKIHKTAEFPKKVWEYLELT